MTAARASGRPVAMPRKKDPDKMTAREHIADVLQWAERQGFANIAAALQRALKRIVSARIVMPIIGA